MVLESKIQSKGRKRALKAGWLNIRISKSIGRGKPDDWFGKRRRSVFVEWKRSADEKPNRQQEKRHKELREQGFECYVLWDDDELMDILEGAGGL